jgi:hypothetical protein
MYSDSKIILADSASSGEGMLPKMERGSLNVEKAEVEPLSVR